MKLEVSKLILKSSKHGSEHGSEHCSKHGSKHGSSFKTWLSTTSKHKL
jgi:hypothetical protein